LGDYLKANLKGPWTRFRAAVAFVKRSGTKHLTASLAEFAKTNGVEIIAGIDHRGTSQEGLRDLLDAVAPKGRVIVFHNRLPMTFHPKIYLFKSDTAAEVIIGSGNLTEGGLFTNYEASLRLQLDLTNATQSAVLKSVEDVLDAWIDPSKGMALPLDVPLLTKLVALGLVPVEALTAPETGEEGDAGAGPADDDGEDKGEPAESPFAAHAEPHAPFAAKPSSAAAPPGTTSVVVPATPPVQPASSGGTTGFVMTLQRTDVGVGQTTTGTSRRSPEIFIPLSARDADPTFWGWQSAFTQDPSKPGKYDRQGVLMRIGTVTISVNMMTWPDKHDFRLRSEALRSAGSIGDIMRIEKVDPSKGFEYYVEVIPQGTTQHPVYLALCNHPVRNSKKRYGYY
jgi:HKD family nuclease